MVEQQISSDINNAESKGRVELWRILPEPPQIDYLVSLSQDETKLLIVLRPVQFEGRFLNITFDNALCVLNTQEGFSLNSVDPFAKDLWGATFFIVANSAFIRQFHENSSWAFDDLHITHYAIFTSNFCVDVLSTEEPSVTWQANIPKLKE